ncbi:MAG TPA: serine protease, partial [Candidatus Cloacimonadota bacterium]|nr:serine protease [Candidatus Cloacimonadota bacterium]
MNLIQERVQLMQRLEKIRKTKVLLYITGDRPGWETQVHQEVLGHFAKHLELMYKKTKVQKLSLYLYTRGGNTLAAWSIISLVRQYCNELEIIVPSRAHSAGTLMCLGSSRIVMTKQSTLGPIDPNINTPLNPPIPTMPGQTIPVSVEAINGYIELVKKEFGITDNNALVDVVKVLSDKIHPLVLGEVYRARTQIKMLAKKLLAFHLPQSDQEKINKIVSFLCTDSGSHDYTINLVDARDLGLIIEEADKPNREIINSIFSTLEEELELDTPFDPIRLLGTKDNADYCNRRAI